MSKRRVVQGGSPPRSLLSSAVTVAHQATQFLCAICQTWQMASDDDKARAELQATFGDVDVNDCVLVCDDCWEKVKPA